MAFVKAGCRGGRLGTTSKARTLRRDIEPGQNLFDSAVDKSPGAHILRLFLAPDDLCVAVALQHFGERIGREWVKLLDADQRDAAVAAVSPCLRKVEIDLACA